MPLAEDAEIGDPEKTENKPVADPKKKKKNKKKKTTEKNGKTQSDDDFDDILKSMADVPTGGGNVKDGKGKEEVVAAPSPKIDEDAKVPTDDSGYFQDNSASCLLASWTSPLRGQTMPPTIPVDKLMTTFPLGKIVHYKESFNTFRITSEEKRELERLQEYDYTAARRAAEVHRQVRRYIQGVIKPGMALIDIVEKLEAKLLQLVAANGLESGFGFPTGCSLNHIAAHWTPNPGVQDRKIVLGYDDVCKFDFGVHVNGRIIDCAWTTAFNPKFNNLLQASKDGTEAGLEACGIDARFSEVGGAIQEAIESYELELDGKTFPIQAIRNLNGHSIGPYQIHYGKSVPIIKNHDQTKMEEGEFFAIETFASTGKAWVNEDMECSHYMKNTNMTKTPALRTKASKDLLHCIDKHFGTLPFCRRWLEDKGQTRHLMALKNLVDLEVLDACPPLCENKGALVSQWEHTILLRPTCKEIMSKGDDF
eukprot:Platyproteum_vivax@DN10253_c0_g1_i1.p1